MKYINAHCHIDSVDELPTEDGIVVAICNSAQMSDWNQVLKLSSVDKNIIACLGIHPWYINTVEPNWNDILQGILADNPKIMVGEIGLDKNYPDMPLQIEFFCRQIKIAYNYNRTVHIHCVGAWNDILKILKDMNLHVPRMVMHAFNGTIEVMNELLRKYDVYFSFGPDVLDIRRNRLRDCVIHVPQNRMLVETDDNPMYILPNIVNELAQIRGYSVDTMANALYKNTLKILD